LLLNVFFLLVITYIVFVLPSLYLLVHTRITTLTHTAQHNQSTILIYLSYHYYLSCTLHHSYTSYTQIYLILFLQNFRLSTPSCQHFNRRCTSSFDQPSSHDSSLNRNPFIETTLTYALTYISSHSHTQLIAPSSLSILANQAYYSNPGTSRSPTSPFLDFDVTLQQAHKTGLGSSAALVTAFTAALLTYYLPKSVFDIDSEDGHRVLHNLSQAAHCAAQGKVGSGFDIASAVYGSCLYRRFSPTLLSSLPAPGSHNFSTQLRALVEGSAWDTEIRKAAIKMPSGLRLVMCDVDCGSETPGMVKKVLKWRGENREEADAIWDALQKGNEAVAAELTRLATSESADANAGEKYAKLEGIIKENRALIRRMSKASQVPIEPPQQTTLLDTCSGIPGIIGGVVPGAGGYDAIVLLLEDKEEVIESLKKVLAGWKVDASENEDGVTIGKVGILGVREDMVGVRWEDPALYREWIAS
jgi:phosphomevalonate kinase